jgi:rifampicin phosphotransferase
MEVQMTFTRQFDEIGRYDVALAGGKGANLGELSSAGLPVPAGFVVTTGAYDAFVEASGIKGEILALASGAEDPACFEAASEWIGALFFRSGFPKELAEEVRTAYEQMAREGQTAVALRSSATAEDLPEASFAGQQETFLNVRGQDAVLEAVRRCWASLWTARAMAYRRRQGTDPISVSLAVVVQ